MSGFDDYLNASPGATPAPSFDAYLSAAPAAAAPIPAAAPNSSASPGYINSFVTGVGHGIGKGAIGVEQAAGQLVNGFGHFPNAAGNYLLNDSAQAQQQNDATFAPAEQAHPIVAGAGNLAGQFAVTAPTLMIGPEYAALSLPGKIGLSAAQGAASSAMMPVEDPNGNFLTQKAEQIGLGGALGGAIPVGAAAGGAIARNVSGLIRPVVQPARYVGEGLAGSLSPQEAHAVAANIRGAPTFVPGSVPTTAQAGANPVLVQTEKALANSSPGFKAQLENLGNANNQARWDALQGVAQTPQALQAAQAARAAQTQPLYAVAHASTANVDPTLGSILQIPEVQEAATAGNRNAALDAAAGRGVAPVWPTPQSPTINGAALDYTSRSLDDMIGSAVRNGQNSRAASLRAIQGQLDNWTTANIPGVQDASDAYARMSVPINTMQGGQQMADTLGNVRAQNSSGVPIISLAAYRGAMNSALKSQPYGIDSSAQGVLDNIGNDLSRSTISNSVRTGGSDTAYNLAANGWLARQLYGPAFAGASGPGKVIGAIGATALGHPMAGLGILGAGNKVGQLVGNRLQARLSNLLLDPQSFLPYLDNRVATAANPVQQSLAQRLLQYGRPTLVNTGAQLPNNSNH